MFAKEKGHKEIVDLLKILLKAPPLPKLLQTVAPAKVQLKTKEDKEMITVDKRIKILNRILKAKRSEHKKRNVQTLAVAVHTKVPINMFGKGRALYEKAQGLIPNNASRPPYPKKAGVDVALPPLSSEKIDSILANFRA